MTEPTDREADATRAEPDPDAAPGATGLFFTLLFAFAFLAHVAYDAIEGGYNGIQNSLLLALMATSPPGVRAGQRLTIRVLERLSGGRGGDRP